MVTRLAKAFALLLAATIVLSGCSKGITLTVTNGCDHPIDAQVFVYMEAPGKERGGPFSDSGHVERYAVGETKKMSFHTTAPGTFHAEIITNAHGEARADHFADGHDLPNDYTIRGAMCLTQPEEPTP